MKREYGAHSDFMSLVAEEAEDRQREIGECLKSAFSDHLVRREVDVIVFSEVTVSELCDAIISFPVLLKPLLVVCNLGGRAIKRDLGLEIDTYRPRLVREVAMALAGYVKPFLPRAVELGALVLSDRCEFVDKEIRKWKGNWEKAVVKALSSVSGLDFKKRKFTVSGDKYEIDAAHPGTGDISIAVDVKRIEAQRDIHKRCDEIERKSRKLKEKYPDSTFGAVIYYPFIDEHSNVQNRLRSDSIDMVVFASQSKSSIERAAQMLLDGVRQRGLGL